MAETKTDEANGIVRRHMLGALVIGLVPLPLVDIVGLSGIQLKMLKSLARLYGVAFSEQFGKSLIASLLGGGGSVSLSSNTAKLLKGVPFFGTIGMFSTSLFGGAATYAIGKVFIQHFESGGTFLNFDPQQVREHYAAQLARGKEVISGSFVGVKP